jgi:hypothetical protein
VRGRGVGVRCFFKVGFSTWMRRRRPPRPAACTRASDAELRRRATWILERRAEGLRGLGLRPLGQCLCCAMAWSCVPTRHDTLNNANKATATRFLLTGKKRSGAGARRKTKQPIISSYRRCHANVNRIIKAGFRKWQPSLTH